jgi:hypothetical protein
MDKKSFMPRTIVPQSQPGVERPFRRQPKDKDHCQKIGCAEKKRPFLQEQFLQSNTGQNRQTPYRHSPSIVGRSELREVPNVRINTWGSVANSFKREDAEKYAKADQVRFEWIAHVSAPPLKYGKATTEKFSAVLARRPDFSQRARGASLPYRKVLW